MDDDIADAISRLLLVSGGSTKAKQFLEAYIDVEGDSSNSASVSTPLSDSAGLPNAATLPLFFSSSTVNPWQEDIGAPTLVLDHPTTSTSPRSDAAPSHRLRSGKQPWDGRAYSKTAHGLTDGSPAWGDSQDLSSSVPSMTPVRSQSERTRSVKTPDHRPLSYGTHGSLSPAPTISTFSQEPDQPFSLRNLSLTSNREPGYINRNNTVALAVGSPSPARSRKTASNSPGIHPHLAAISMAQSSLSKKELLDVKLKIKADPDYVGGVPYIRIQNPQYKIRVLVHAPPKSGNGKWYQVSRGTAVGVFNNWHQAAKATQGVPKSIHKSFGTRGEAIVAYQIALLRGEVLLMNEKLEDKEETDDEAECRNLEV